MNRWYRTVVRVEAKDAATIKVGAIMSALTDITGADVFTNDQAKGMIALEYEHDDCLQAHDEEALVKAVWGATGKCKVTIMEHAIEESDPDEQVYEADHKFAKEVK